MNSGFFLISIIGMALQAAFIAVEHKKKYLPAVILKGCASLMFVLIGILAARTTGNPHYAKLVILGLCFGALGDIFLNLRFLSKEHGQKIFLTGIAVFFAGHIMYLIALIPLSEHLLISLLIGAALAALLLTYIFRRLNVKPAFKIFGIFYLGAIVLMSAVAIGNAITGPDTMSLLFATGAVLFTVSDIVLIFNTFGDRTTFSRRIANLSCYYIAQLLIAFTIFFA